MNATAAYPTRTWELPIWLKQLFAIDVRALAALRIGFAGVLLYDTLVRALSLTAHYTDAGILTREALRSIEWDFNEPWWMSLHMLSGSPLWAGLLSCCSFVAACCLLVGYRTKIALFASWLLLYSVQARFPLLLQGGDVLLRCGLVWMFFLPLDARWSCSTSTVTCPASGVVSWGTMALMLQLLAMYFFSALLKTSPLWLENCHATFFALKIDHFTSPFGYQMAEHPLLLQWITSITLQVELWGPFLLFIPRWQPLWRWLVPLCFIGFHLGLVMCLDLGTFPWICILYWTIFLPATFWDGVEQLAHRYLPWFNRTSQPAATSNCTEDICVAGSRELNLVAMFLTAYMLLLNVQKLHHPFATVGRPPLSWVAKLTGLNQYWNMFAPGPYQYSSWLRVEGELADGTLVNLYQPAAALDDEQPSYVSGTYPTQYWRRCMVMSFEFAEPVHQVGILRYFSERWNATHQPEQQVVRARLVHMLRNVPLPESTLAETPPWRRNVLSEWVKS
jgi:hypothetical protein